MRLLRSLPMVRRVVIVLVIAACAATRVSTDTLARLTDQEFWRLSADASEPGGYFRAQNITNLTSNEVWMQYVIHDLVARTRPGGVYLGVGPEQNFTYIAAVKPSMAVIFDIRRGNLDLQLMYKAMFELSADRADFVSMLFSRPRPQGLTKTSTAREIFSAFSTSSSSQALFTKNLHAIETQLTKTHTLPLAADDVTGIEEVYLEFARGFAVRPSPTYDELMTATDASGVSLSYLSTEERFGVMKE